MPTPLLIYKFDEASSGTAPTSILDYSTGTAFPLTPTYTGTAAWSSISAGKGLTFGSDESTRIASAAVGSNKVKTAVHGATKFTWEFVVNFTGSSHGALIVDLLDNSSAQAVGIYTSSSGGWEIWTDFADATQNFSLAAPSGVTVVHVVFDSTQATAGNRVRVYFNGVSQTLTAGTTIPQNRTLVVTTTSLIQLGGPVFPFSQTGAVYYLACYAAALTAGEVSTNATALAANNDADPNAGSGPINLSTGLATETETALSLSLSKIRAAGTSAETDAAPAGLTLSRVKTPGMSAEADFASALQLSKVVAHGLSTETDSATVGPLLSKPLATGQATSANAALALALSKTLATGQASETDAAFSTKSGTQTLAPGVSAESDTSKAVPWFATRAAETSAALVPGTLSKMLSAGVAVVAETALALALVKTALLGVAIETDSATVGPALSKVLAAGNSSETDTAFSTKAGTQNISPGVALEADTARAPAWYALRAGETSAALVPGTLSKLLMPGLASEADTALALRRALVPGVAVEISEAFGALAGATYLSPGVSLEGNAARAPFWYTLGARETDTALALVVGTVSPIHAGFAEVGYDEPPCDVGYEVC